MSAELTLKNGKQDDGVHKTANEQSSKAAKSKREDYQMLVVGETWMRSLS